MKTKEKTLAEKLQTATISRETRDLIVLVGKLNDIGDEYLHIKQQWFGEDCFEVNCQPFFNAIINAQEVIKKELGDIIFSSIFEAATDRDIEL